MLKYKIINYFGDYGTANFWSNISDNEIIEDLQFIKEKGFNTILLLIPYTAFKPFFNNFETKYNHSLELIMNEAKKNNLYVIFRIGYLWESTFDEYRTFERYLDMYSSCKQHVKSRFEDDFIEYIHYYYDNYDFVHMMISWEDFFWPVYYYNASRGDEDNQEIERETIAFMEYLLSKIGHKEKIFIEQRTNGDFDKINYNPSVTYAYYNTLNIQSWDDDFIGENFGRGIIISESMVIQKQFVEWYSRMKARLCLDEKNKIIIDQFNIIDNTFSDDDDHEEFDKSKQKLVCNENNFNEVMDFLTPIIKHNVYGIGFWSLWSTYAGHVYNGTFKFGAEGWETNGYINGGCLYLKLEEYIATNLGYVRLDIDKSWNIFIEYTSLSGCEVKMLFNNSCQIISLKAGNKIQKHIEFHNVSDKRFKVELLEKEIIIHRIDCYNIMHKSILFNEKREPEFGLASLKSLMN